MKMDQRRKSALPDAGTVTRQLELMLTSSDFKATPQQIALLKYVVGQTLAGKADLIKGYTVATEVFGRGSDFDQNIDPIVSIQASRLRRALARYYQGAGKHDPLRIEIPKGSYVPVFEARLQAPVTVSRSKTPQTASKVRAGKYWPTVLVRPVQNVSADPALDTWSIGLAAELADELNRYPDIRVMTPDSDASPTADDKRSPRFFLDGSVRSDRDCIKVILYLTDARTRRQIWSNSCRSETGSCSSIAFQERVSRLTAVRVAGKRGWIAKTVSREFQNGGSPGSEAYEAVLRYNEFRASSTPEAFRRALTALERAVAVDPDCGQVWTTRARFFTVVHILDIPGFERPLDQALAFALKGLRLTPDDQRTHSVMALIHLLRNDLEAGRMQAERALQLGPETLFILDGIGYILTLMGEWERGPALIEKAIRRNPFYSNYVHYALWLNWIRQGDYDLAYQETMKLNRPADFWDHLTKAATLGLRGDIEEGRRCAAELLRLKPDFPQRGRRLIRYFIKFDDIFDRVLAGLEAVGVNIS